MRGNDADLPVEWNCEEYYVVAPFHRLLHNICVSSWWAEFDSLQLLRVPTPSCGRELFWTFLADISSRTNITCCSVLVLRPDCDIVLCCSRYGVRHLVYNKPFLV